MNNLFGTDGIRGKANAFPMDTQTALDVGRALALFFRQKNEGSHVVIGQDTRISGDMLAFAVAAGICSAGLDVVLLGVMPTPGVAYTAAATSAAGGVVISASHNPYADNGIKVFNSEGYKLTDQDETWIESSIARKDDATVLPAEIGRLKQIKNAPARYLEFLKQAVPDLSLKGITIALDCAHGATHQIAPLFFAQLGARVVPLACMPDGVNINENCGSQHPETLSRSVVENQADLGLAFDGDGDRLIAVDDKGKVLTGDQIMVICANHLLRKGKLKHRKVVTTVMSNLGFHLALKSLDVETVVTPVGDRYVIEKMIAEDAVLGGEDSGHMIFRECHTTGDGLMAALHLIDAVKTAAKPLSELSKLMTVFPQCLINVDVDRKPDLQFIPEVKAVIDRIEHTLGSQGRVLVRYSGTQNTCRVMVEAPTREKTQAYCEEIAEVVRRSINE
jgi:phosphoglucosamine mutase